MACQPRFSEDYTKLLYYSKKEEFLSHTTNYELRYLKWPKTSNEEESVIAIPAHKEYPNKDQEFAGLYGHNLNFVHYGFFHSSNKYAVFESHIMGQTRVFLTDVET